MAPVGGVWSRNSPIRPSATTLSYSGGPWPQLARSPLHPSSSACSLQPEFHLSLLLHHPPKILPHPIYWAGPDVSQG